MNLVVAIPCFNEEKTIEDVIVNMSEQDHERKFEKLLINTLDGEINVDVLSPGEIHE